VGEGTFGQAFKAKDTKQNNKIVTLKFFKNPYTGFLLKGRDIAGDGDSYNAVIEARHECRLMYELQLKKGLDNKKQRFVRCLGDYSNPGFAPDNNLFVTLEYGGTALDVYMTTNHLELEQVCDIVKQMIEGLVYMAANTGESDFEKLEWIHHDIKPSNLVVKKVQQDGTDRMLLKYIDFGTLIHAHDSWVSNYQDMPRFITTPVYAPLEWAQQKLMKPWSSYDMFQVAVTIVEVFSGLTTIELFKAVKATMRSNSIRNWDAYVKGIWPGDSWLDEFRLGKIGDTSDVVSQLETDGNSKYVNKLNTLVQWMMIGICAQGYLSNSRDVWISILIRKEQIDHVCKESAKPKLEVLRKFLSKSCSGFWMKLLDAHETDATRRPLPAQFLEALTPECAAGFGDDIQDEEFATVESHCPSNVVKTCWNPNNNILPNSDSCPSHSRCQVENNAHWTGYCVCEQDKCAYGEECVDYKVEPPTFYLKKGYDALTPLSSDMRIKQAHVSDEAECHEKAKTYDLFTYRERVCYFTSMEEARAMNVAYIAQWKNAESAFTGVNIVKYDRPLEELSDIDIQSQERFLPGEPNVDDPNGEDNPNNSGPAL